MDLNEQYKLEKMITIDTLYGIRPIEDTVKAFRQ